MHKTEECKKCSESTVGTGTDVIPVIFALNIFAVYAPMTSIFMMKMLIQWMRIKFG